MRNPRRVSFSVMMDVLGMSSIAIPSAITHTSISGSTESMVTLLVPAGKSRAMVRASRVPYEMPNRSHVGYPRASRSSSTSAALDALSKSGTHFYIEKLATGVSQRTCDQPGQGGCKAADAQGNQW